MPDIRTEEMAALYVLDLLTATERRQFEDLMASSAEVATLVRELSGGLLAPLRKEEGPARIDLLEGIHARLGLASQAPAAPARPPRQPASLPWSVIWGVAAALLLGMNLLLVWRVREMSAVRPADVLAQAGAEAPGSAGDPQEGSSPAGQLAVLEARIARLEADLDRREAELTASRQAATELKEENTEVKAYNAGWQREYMRLAARIRPFFEPEDGLSRFTVIEMVDAGTYDNQLPRRGFADLAGRFLTGEGNIAGAGPGEFVGPLVEGAGLASVTDSGPSGLTPVARGLSQGQEVAGISGDLTAPADPQQVAVDEAMGFTVWRDDEQKGFLDIYNLPPANPGQDAYLWVRSSELEQYVPIGFLPELDAGTGSFFYSVDEPEFTPTEILITSEDAVNPGPQPSGSVLLRGP